MRRCILGALATLTVPAIAVAAARAPTSMSVQITGSHVVTIKATVLAVNEATGLAGRPIHVRAPLKLTLADNVGRPLATFKLRSATRCRIRVAAGRSRVTFSAPARRRGWPAPCNIRRVSGPVTLSYTISAAFAGTRSYQPSTSKPYAIFYGP